MTDDKWVRVESRRGYVDTYVNINAIYRIEITMYNEKARLSLLDGSRELADPRDVEWLIKPLLLTSS